MAFGDKGLFVEATLMRSDDNYYIKLKTYKTKLFSSNRGDTQYLKLLNGKVVQLVNNEFKVAEKDGEYFLSQSYQLSAEDVTNLSSSLIAKCRFTYDDQLFDVDIKSKLSKSIHSNLKCLL